MTALLSPSPFQPLIAACFGESPSSCVYRPVRYMMNALPQVVSAFFPSYPRLFSLMDPALFAANTLRQQLKAKILFKTFEKF